MLLQLELATVTKIILVVFVRSRSGSERASQLVSVRVAALKEHRYFMLW
ncbi:MAG: hypothetical protein F6K65_33885 [Moorea sp. SIO3C2]|nr:hypothetical protein [Moorena sp. SIO3C2]